MAKFFRHMVIGAALAVPLMLGGATGTATAAPSAVFPVPVVTGPEIGPGGVPGGMFQTIPVAATVERPGIVTFTVPAPASYHYQYNYRWISVQWRNLETGATGSVDLRHWHGVSDTGDRSYAATLPTSASVVTGTGPIIATVTHQRAQYQAPPMSNAVVPGVGVLVA